MLEIQFELRTLAKRIPLTISRGTGSPHAELIHVRITSSHSIPPSPEVPAPSTDPGSRIEGWGESMAFGIGTFRESTQDILDGLNRARKLLRDADPWRREACLHQLEQAQVSRAAMAGVDQALWDWAGKQMGQPVYRIWGFDPEKGPPTSVTIGIGTPEAAQRRVQLWREQLNGIRVFKVKLGSPEGIRADQRMFDAVLETIRDTPFHRGSIAVSVDANGGWTLEDAKLMAGWLADRGVDHIEQPLARGCEAQLKELRCHCPLPLLADESCLSACEIPGLAGLVDGINVKHFKCGGLSRALEMIHVARAHGMKVMLGCYANGTLSNTAVAHLGGGVDYLDLDSHLNLESDPFEGAVWNDGFLRLPNSPGFGVRLPNPETHPR